MWRGRKVLYATKHLLMKHALTDTADAQGFSPLHIAVLNAATSAFYLPVVETLLKGGATGNEELMAPTPTYFIVPGVVQAPQQRARDIGEGTRKRPRTCDNLMRNKRNCPVGY